MIKNKNIHVTQQLQNHTISIDRNRNDQINQSTITYTSS